MPIHQYANMPINAKMPTMKEFVLSGNQNPKKLRIDYQKELNAEQFDVVQNGDGPTLVLAGAGSGKTRTITYRVAWLLEHGINPSNILLLTFTNKAAKEMLDRVEQLLGSYPDGLWGGTFHSIANRLLRKYAREIGYESNFSILDQDDSRDLVKLCLKELKIDTKGKRFPSANVLHALISFQRNKGCDLETALELKHPKFLPLLSEIQNVAELYSDLKRQQNAMDFDDLLLRLLELLKSRPEIQQSLSNMFEFVLVDEFQDTNVIQAEIVKLLASVHGNLLVVGDDAQSIYSFRAAEIKNILNFPRDHQATRTYRLTKNYRSTPEVLSVANAVIANNENQFAKELEAVCTSGDKPCLVPAANSSQEAQYVVEQILELYDAGTSFCDMAVLFRAAFHSQAVEFELMKRDIPYEYRGGMKFFERAHIKDAISHLRIFNNHKDGMAWMRLLQVHPGIGLVTAGKIANLCGQCQKLVDVKEIDVPGGAKARAGWASCLRVLKDLESGKSTAEMIRLLAANDEYRAYLEAEYPNFQERLEDIEQFALFAEQFDDLGEFLESVSLTGDYGAIVEDQTDDEADRLILSTIHQAKGLEWQTVFIINLAEGAFPHARALNEAGGLEEERRLFYVASTRARKRLFLTYAITAGFDKVEIRQPSMFVDEIPSKQIETVKLRRSLTNFRPDQTKSGFGITDDFFDEPTIVLDSDGEAIHKDPPSSFLRNIDEL